MCERDYMILSRVTQKSKKIQSGFIKYMCSLKLTELTHAESPPHKLMRKAIKRRGDTCRISHFHLLPLGDFFFFFFGSISVNSPRNEERVEKIGKKWERRVNQAFNDKAVISP